MVCDHSGGNAGHNRWRGNIFYGVHRENFVNFTPFAGSALTSHPMREPYEVCEVKGQKSA
jgi:hypothetical protein